VIAQDPDAMSLLDPGGAVDLTVSTGKPDVVVPYVLGEDKDTARQKVTDAGLKVTLVKKQSDEEQDTVIGTDPNPATSVSKGSSVTVFYSAGPREVPSVVGLQEDAARDKLEAAGFEVDTVLDSKTDAKRGTVLKQSPGAYTKQPQHTTVVITVSDFTTPTPTPTESPTESPSSPTSPSSSLTP
jgi:eukaryotic-like serine/threonine-protein kinase